MRAVEATSTSSSAAAERRATAAGSKKHQLSSAGEVLAGGIAGAFSRGLVAPLDVIKIRFQLQLEPVRQRYGARATELQGLYTGVFQAGRQLLKEEGVKTLWRGNIAAMSLWVSYAAIQFPAYRAIKAWLHRFPILEETSLLHHHHHQPSSKSSVAAVIAGGTAGAFATVATYPFDWIRTRFACQGVPRQYDSYADLLVKEFKKSNGRITVFFQGLSPNLIAVVPQIAITFATYEKASAAAEWTLRHALPPMLDRMTAALGGSAESSETGDAEGKKKQQGEEEKKEGTGLLQLSQALGGGIAGAVSKLAVYPLDTVKKRLQTQEMERASYFGRRPAVRYSGVWDALTKIAREDRAEQLLKAAPTSTTAVAAGSPPSSAPSSATATATTTPRTPPFYYRAPVIRHLFVSRWFPFAWFKGLSPSLIKAAAGAALTFWSYEAASRALFDNFEWARAKAKAKAETNKAASNDEDA